MTRPVFSTRSSSSAKPEPKPGVAEPSETAGDVAPVAVAKPSNVNEDLQRSDDLTAMFLSLSRPGAPETPIVQPPTAVESEQLPAAGGGLTHAERAPAEAPSVQQAPVVARPAFGSRPRFGSGDQVRSEPASRTGAPSDMQAGGDGPAQSIAADDSMPDFGLGKLPTKLEPPPVPVYEAQKGPFAKKDTLSAAAVRALRSDVKSASIVTELVSAMALHPGSDADVALKSKVLTSLLVQARQSADDLIGMVDPERADVGWVRAQALSQTASMLAREWTSDVLSEDEMRRRMDVRMNLVRAVLMDQGGEVERALGDFANGDRYKECVDAQSAADHRAVAIHQAAWALTDAVVAVKGKEGQVFSFGMAQGDMVAALLQQAISIVNGSRPDIRDPEASTTYMRGAFRRATTLVAAEYRGKAAEACAWVDAADGQEQAGQRLGACPKMFADTVMPFISHWGLKNFQSIERAARKLIEESQDEQTSADRPGH